MRAPILLNLILIFSFLTSRSQCPLGVSGTFTVGPSGNYSTLQAALNDLHTKGLAGAVVLELQPGYSSTTETFPIAARAIGCAGPGKGVTIRPGAGTAPLTISSNDSTATIDLNNTTYITLDGRAGGTGSPLSLIINNTNVNGSAVRFINGASHNRLAFLDLHGVTTYPSRGVIAIAGSDSATANNYNRIDSCNISNGATDPVTGIGTASPAYPLKNIGNAVTGCNIFNFWGAWPNTGTGISVSPGNDSASILANSFYQTKNREYTLPDYASHYQLAAVWVDNSYAGPINVSGNYIGGTAPLGGGGVLKISGCQNFIGIKVANGSSGITRPAIVNDNVIGNLTLKDNYGAYTMIELNPFNGVCKNNTIGCLGSFNLLTATGTEQSINFTGIDVVSQDNDSSTISGNHISGISVSAPSYNWMIGIQVNMSFNGASHCLVENNVIGNTDVGAISVTGYGDLDGILVNTENDTYANTPSHFVIRGNTISGTGSTSCRNRGIWTTGKVLGTVQITGNNILRLMAGDAASVTPSPVDIRGISMEIFNNPGSIGTLSCTDNKVYDLLANASQNDKMAGIYIENISRTGGNLTTNISRNLIKQLFLSGVPGKYDYAQVAGLVDDDGPDRITADNNIIQLGYTEGSDPPPCPYFGIRHLSGPAIYLHNTILLQGGIRMPDNRPGLIFGTCFNRVDSSSCTLLNNLFAITRTYIPDSVNPHFSIIELASHKDFTADYNLYYGINKCLTGLNNSPYYISGYAYITPGNPTNYQTLADWQAATGFDKHSLSADPLLMDPDHDLLTPPHGVHLSYHSPAEGAGTADSVGAIAATTLTDFDGELRASLTPVDIGADAGNFNGAPPPPPPPVDTTRHDTTALPPMADSLAMATPAPNPFSGTLNVFIHADSAGTATISLFTFSGNLIISLKVSVIKGDNRIPVPMDSYPDGTYVLKVELYGKKSTVLVMKKTS